MGLVPSNSAFDRFHQQAMAGHDDILTARAIKDGTVEFVDDEGTVMQTLVFPRTGISTIVRPASSTSHVHHGTDDGRVLFYTLR
jgi:hypothetical protein